MLHLNLSLYIVITLIITHITCMAVTLFLHRCQAHRSLDMHPILSHFFRAWLWLTTGMVTKAWVAIHRKHHAHCETEDDPHSPQIFGLPIVLWQGAELYKKEAKIIQTLDKYGKGTPDDWIERNLYTKYSSYGIFIPLVINLLLFGVGPGLCIWSIQMAWIPFLAAGVINGVGHYYGYRNFESRDSSTNIVPWGILICGEELHNNHHAFGSSAKFSCKPWEFDIGWMYIKIFGWLKLVKVRRVAPQVKIQQQKNVIDLQTVKAVFANRLTIVANFNKEVLLPLFYEEKRQVITRYKSLFNRKMSQLLRRECTMIDEIDKLQLQSLLSVNDKLNTVYQMKINFQRIWEKTSSSQKELIQSLQDWCMQAKKCEIKLLCEFTNKIYQFI